MPTSRNFSEKIISVCLIGIIVVLYMLEDITGLEAIILGSLNGMYLGISFITTMPKIHNFTTTV